MNEFDKYERSITVCAIVAFWMHEKVKMTDSDKAYLQECLDKIEDQVIQEPAGEDLRSREVMLSAVRKLMEGI